MYACHPETGRGFFEGVCAPSNATANFCDPPHSAIQENRSPNTGAPARSGSFAALLWTALRLRVDVDHYPHGSRAPLASHPLIALRVVDAPLEASQAGTLLVRVRSCSSYDHAIISSTSWS